MAALAATHKPLPAQIPEIQFDWIKPGLAPGLSFRITLEGPVDHPSSALISLGSPSRPPAAASATARPLRQRPDARAENGPAAADARFRASLRYPPGSPEDLCQKAEQAVLQGALRRFALGPLHPGRQCPPAAGAVYGSC